MESLLALRHLTFTTIGAVLDVSKAGLSLRNEEHPLNYGAIGRLRSVGGFAHDDLGSSSNKSKVLRVGFFIPYKIQHSNKK